MQQDMTHITDYVTLKQSGFIGFKDKRLFFLPSDTEPDPEHPPEDQVLFIDFESRNIHQRFQQNFNTFLDGLWINIQSFQIQQKGVS